MGLDTENFRDELICPSGNSTRLHFRHCERKRSNPSRGEKKEWIASSLHSSQ
jgi:hypothetical protein